MTNDFSITTFLNTAGPIYLAVIALLVAIIALGKFKKPPLRDK